MPMTSVVDAIGNTPLIRLNALSDATGCEILGKAEFMNPGQSVKDRPARQMILEAEARGDLRPGGVIVEGTAGNTGIGLALVARARGYRCIIVMPDTQSQEKKDTLRLAGAELIEVPAKPFSNPNNYQKVARRLAEDLTSQGDNGVLFADQWNNLDNRKAHFLTTGPEIWRDTEGRVDAFICAVGTGGTLSGTSSFLREQKSDFIVGCADPLGAAMFSYFSNGEAKSSDGGSVSEGIGLGRVTPIIDGLKVDYAYSIPDAEALPLMYDLAKTEGIVLGGSSAINMAGAVRLAKELGPGHTIVTILCDHGSRYQSKLYNPDFLASKSIDIPSWLTASTELKAPLIEVSA